MNNTNDYHADSPILRQASRNRCLLAFLVTSLAVFLSIGLTWPLTMRGYQTEGEIEFENQEIASSLIQNELPSVLKTVMHPNAMLNRLGESAPQTEGELNRIYQRIGVGFRGQTDTHKPRLRVVFS